MALTKQGLAEQFQSRFGFHKRQSVEITQTLLEIIKSTLGSGEDVLVSGFGKFSVKEKKARKDRNPCTGEIDILPARRVETYKCSGKLREKISRE